MAAGAWVDWTDQKVLHPDRQAGAVMEAALRLFEANGARATAIEDVRMQADASVGTIYHHFGNKDGLATALYVQALIGFQRGLNEILTVDGGAERVVRGFVEYQVRWVADNPAKARLLASRRELEPLAAGGERVDRLNRRLLARVEIWYRPRVEAGEIRALDQPLLHAVWLGPAIEYTRLALERSRRFERDEMLAAEGALAEAAWVALKPEAGGLDSEDGRVRLAGDGQPDRRGPDPARAR